MNLSMDASRTYDFPRPAVTVDVVLLRVAQSARCLEVLLVQRGLPPFAGQWALPGGFVRENEDLAVAAERELEEESGLKETALQQVATIGSPGRDPRGHTVTVLFTTLVARQDQLPQAGGDASATQWFAIDHLPEMAFDHAKLFQLALGHVRDHLADVPIVFELLPKRFTLSELQDLCETILGRPLDPRNFRRRVQELGLVVPTKESRRAGAHRPAQLFRFDAREFSRYTKRRRMLPY